MVEDRNKLHESIKETKEWKVLETKKYVIWVDQFKCDENYCCLENCCLRPNDEGCGRILTAWTKFDKEKQEEVWQKEF